MSGNHAKGCRRDKLIREAIDRHGALDTDMVHLMFFRDISTGRRTAQLRLKRLHERGYIRRARESFDQPYYYFTGKKSGQLEHRLGVNWVYLWLLLSLKSWETLHCFDYELDYKTLRADAFTAVKNKVNKDTPFKFYFIEFDRAESGNKFDKFEKYSDLFQSERYMEYNTWWIPLASRFPVVLIVTTNSARARALREQAKQYADPKLYPEFRIYELSEIQEECYYAGITP